jgi:PDZ domain-containing protein
MSRRTVSSLLASLLLAALFYVAASLPVPYVTMSPGPTVDVLAERRGAEIVQVEGAKRYETDGRLELTTVSVTGPTTKLGLLPVLVAWFDPSKAVYPRELFYDKDDSAEDVRTESSVQMVSSQDTAIAAALTELDFDLDRVTEVFAVTKDSPADGRLETRDRILSVDGTSVRRASDVARLVQRAGAGNEVAIGIRRDGKTRTVRVTPKESEDEPKQARIGVVVGEGYDFPFEVSVNIDEKIGGPSAGLIFSLAVYDTLTPGSLTHGGAVAGTGTISADGSVGPIGGIQQKIVAATDSGAEIFLVPPGNCDEAVATGVDGEEIRLVKARTLHSAVRALKAHAADPDAELPRCG